MPTRNHRRFWRLSAGALAILMAATLIVPNPAAAFRGRHILVDRHPRGPRIGHYVGHLPPGYHRIQVGPLPYFFHGGSYYRPVHHRRGYVVARPPVGAVLAALPLGFLTLAIGSMIYYYHSDVYYRRVPAGYMVVDPPREVVVVRETPASAAPESPSGDRVVVTAPRLNVRSGPAGSFAVITIIEQGAALEVHGSAPDWLYVRLGDGRYGWVQETYTTPIVPPADG